MAHVIDRLSPSRPEGHPVKYPWDTWLDGKRRRLVPGVDFTCKPDTMRSNIAKYAAKFGCEAEVKVQKNGRVVFRFGVIPSHGKANKSTLR